MPSSHIVPHVPPATSHLLTVSPLLALHWRCLFVFRMKKAEIPCPEVVLLKKHILVMSFIGKDHVPAPKLKDIVLSSEDMKNAFYQVLHVGTNVCMERSNSLQVLLLTPPVEVQLRLQSFKANSLWTRLSACLSLSPPVCLQVMQQLYQECNLVHADLSEYNMLWHDGKVCGVTKYSLLRFFCYFMFLFHIFLLLPLFEL